MERVVMGEGEARSLLGTAGVPLVPQREAASADEAVEAARELGFPVVLKGLGAAHKTEEGLVRLGLADEAAVRRAARELLERVSTLAVQPRVAGRREFLLGAYRDPRFGPVVAFGLGGVLTEALGDAALRLAPVDEDEAARMIGEIRAQALLGAFRGEAEVDRGALARAIAGLSRLVAERPGIAEVDLNPLIARADGSVVAVDALVVEADPARGMPARPPVDTSALARIFHPRSVAVVGASAGFGKWGNAILTNLLAGGYEGRVYPVNPRGGTLCGLPVVRSVDELPDGVDLAIVTLPADKVEPAVEGLARRGVRHAVVVSSGFREAGGDGPEREARLVARARELGVTIIGPNTMGVVNPHVRLYATGAHVRPGPGGTTLVSQSGNLGVQLLSFARAQGLGIRAFCGTGNEAMAGVEDFLEALEHDETSRVVALYLEDVRDGRRFFEACRRVSRKKPVVVLKGGRTGAGQRAAASHTGALAGDTAVFEAACRQAGAVWVTQPGDLLDVSAALSAVPLPRGNRVAVVTWGGGWGVVTADLCAEQGLELPALSPETLAALDALLPSYWSRGNPVDLVGERDPQLPLKALEVLLSDPGIDAVIHLGLLRRDAVVGAMVESARQADPDHDPAFLGQVEEMVAGFEGALLRASAELVDRFGKPVVGVSLVPDPEARTLVPVPGLERRALVFPAPERAVRTLARLAEYAARARAAGAS